MRRRTIPYAVLVVMLAGFAPACGDILGGVSLPGKSFQFPISVAVHPQGFALVVSSNFDLSFESGSVRVVDLNLLAERISDPGPHPDEWHHHLETLKDDYAVSVGSFAGSIRIAAEDEGGLAVLAVRENNELTFIDLEIEPDGQGGSRMKLRCTPGVPSGNSDFPACDGARYLLTVLNDDPYDLLLTEGIEGESGIERTLFVTFLRSAAVKAIQIPPRGSSDAPRVAYERLINAEGANDLARSSATGLIYVTSRPGATRSNLIHYFDPADGENAEVITDDLFVKLLGFETRSLTFTDDGVTLAILQRSPDLLAFLDTTPAENGFPGNTYTGHVTLTTRSSRVRAHGDLLFVTSAEEDTVIAVDASARRLLSRKEDVCRGPFDMAFYDRGDLHWGLIACFEEDTMTVLDVDPDSATFMKVLARIGEPVDKE